MHKMVVVGHRGSAGTELENTLAALRAGIDAGADYLEIDIRLTKDQQIVVCHDPNLARISSSQAVIADLTLEELKHVELHNDERVPTLREALELVGSTPLFIEIKEDHMVRPLIQLLADFPNTHHIVTSFRLREAALYKQLQPKTRVYLATLANPFEIFQTAKTISADGVALRFWLLNPLTYFMAHRRKLSIMVYTINSLFYARFVHFLYPKAMICTDRPGLFHTPRNQPVV